MKSKRTLFFLVSVMLFSSCRHEKKKEKEIVNCEIIENMMYKDNLYRLHPALIDPFFSILDSLKVDAGLSSDDYVNLEKAEQLAFGKLADKIAQKKTKANKKTVDSLWTLQLELDRQNTNQLMQILTTIDYRVLDTLDCFDQSLKIFVHTPNELIDTVRKVVEERRDYIHENRYRHIIWHLDGRKE